MKAYKVLLFMLAVFLLIGIMWRIWPAEGVRVNDSLTLRFASYEREVAEADEPQAVDIDSLLAGVNQSLEKAETLMVQAAMKDSASLVKYVTELAVSEHNQIHLPKNDPTFFDPLFEKMEKAAGEGRLVRIMHYGDSQIEMDRISGVLRQRLQERFGGSGPGMIPAIQAIPGFSINQSYSGSLTRYTMYGDSTTRRAPHKRYGVMCQLAQLSGNGVINFRTSGNRYAQEKVKDISRVTLLFGNSSAGFSATLTCDTLKAETRTLAEAKNGVSTFSWQLPQNVAKGNLKLNGQAEIYALLLDGPDGVTVDNNGLRGCAGFIFSSIDKAMMRQSFELLGTEMIILQFGGNAIVGMNTTGLVNSYVARIEKQIEYFREVAPNALIMFIGPSDMAYSDKATGRMRSYPKLSELNDSLKSMSLRNGAAYWDLFGMMGGENSMTRWVHHNPAYAGPDYIHFTNLGAEHVGNILSKSFLFYYDFYRQRRYGIPMQRDSVNLLPQVKAIEAEMEEASYVGSTSSSDTLRMTQPGFLLEKIDSAGIPDTLRNTLDSLGTDVLVKPDSLGTAALEKSDSLTSITDTLSE